MYAQHGLILNSLVVIHVDILAGGMVRNEVIMGQLKSGRRYH